MISLFCNFVKKTVILLVYYFCSLFIFYGASNTSHEFVNLVLFMNNVALNEWYIYMIFEEYALGTYKMRKNSCSTYLLL